MIIDFHTHIFPPLFRDQRERFFDREPAFELLYRPSGSKLVGAGDLLRTMDEEGVQRSVVFGFPWKRAEHFKQNNDYIIECVRKNPERLVGFACFDPLHPEASREAERCLAAGLSGIGELALYDSDLSPDVIRSFEGFMRIAAERDVPVLLHTNEPVGHEYPGKTTMTLRQIYDFAKAFPQNRLILAHWGGGLVFYGLMKKEVREVLGNVFFDTAASPYLYRPEVYRLAGETLGYDRILFGSDYPLLKPGRYFKDMAVAGLPETALEQIRGENAARLLSLPS